MPRFGYVAGSARAVARARRLGWAGQAVGLAWDVAGRVAGGRRRIVVGKDIVDGGGVVTSLVQAEDIRRDIGRTAWPTLPGALRLAWAGRVAGGKGVEQLLDAVALLARDAPAGRRVDLVMLGDGPLRGRLEQRGHELGIADRVRWAGYVADRGAYLETLAASDLFVFPSPAEGFPKVVLDAMAAGVPVLGHATGQLVDLAIARAMADLTDLTPGGIALTIARLAGDPDAVVGLRAAGTAFVGRHTRIAEASRLAELWERGIVLRTV